MSKKNLKKQHIVESDDENNEEELDNDDIIEDDIDNDLDNEIENDELEDEEEYNIEGDINCNIDENIDEIYDDDILEPETFVKKTNIESSVYVKKEDRISINRLTKYEMVRILGERTKQLTMGAKPLVKNYGVLSYDKIAIAEFKNNMIPYKIIRPLPNGTLELWDFDELYKEHLYSLLENK